MDSTPGAAAAIRRLVERAAQGEFVRTEVTAQKPSGERLIFDLSLYPVQNERGEVTLIVPEARDITEWKQAEAALRDSEEGLRLAQGAAGIGIWDWDLRSGQIHWSSEIYALLAMDPTTKPSMEAWESRLYPEDKIAVMEAVIQAADRSAPDSAGHLETEFRIVRNDGEVRWLLARASVLKSDGGKAIRLLGLNMDITEQKRAQHRTGFLLKLDDAIRALTDPHEVMLAATRLLGQHLDVDRCAYLDVAADGDTFHLAGDYARDNKSLAGRYTFTQFGAECRELMNRDEPWKICDSGTDWRTADVREEYRRREVRAAICVPSISKGGWWPHSRCDREIRVTGGRMKWN